MNTDSLIQEIVRKVVEKLEKITPSQSPQITTTPSQELTAAGGYDNPTRSPETLSAPSTTAQNIINAGACRISGDKENLREREKIARYIDHTLLKPDATEEEIIRLCNEARQYNFASVCVNSSHIPLCTQLLANSGVKVCTVVGFPLGAMATESKAFETLNAVQKGADEIDMVINVGELKSGNYRYVLKDMESVIQAAQGRIVKVILETSLLTDEEKITSCVLAKAAGVDYVKTSTGFSKGGATAHDVALMRKVVGPEMGVKASGGIRTCENALEMIQAGATRIGASASVAIVHPEKQG